MTTPSNQKTIEQIKNSMCAINPTHKKRFIIDVYTSVLMEDFDERVIQILLDIEISLNTHYGAFRFHIKETEQKAD